MPNKKSLKQLRAKAAQRMRRWRAKHPEAAKAASQKARVKYRKRIYAYAKAWKKANADKVREYDRKKYLKRRNAIRAKKYGVSLEVINTLMEITQCEACGSHFGKGNGSVDHDHATGRIRGVLCKPCNHALGVVGECSKRLFALANYCRRRCR